MADKSTASCSSQVDNPTSEPAQQSALPADVLNEQTDSADHTLHELDSSRTEATTDSTPTSSHHSSAVVADSPSNSIGCYNRHPETRADFKQMTTELSSLALREVNNNNTDSHSKHRVLTNTSSVFSTISNRSNCHSEVHDDEAMFCLTCHERCAPSQMSDHQQHELTQVMSAIDNQNTEHDNLMVKVTESLNTMSSWRDFLSGLRADLVKSRKSIAVQLDDMFRDIEHRLQERKMLLFTQLTDLSCHKETYLDDQIHSADAKRTQLLEIRRALDTIKDNIADGSLIAYNCSLLRDHESSLQRLSQQIDNHSLDENTDINICTNGLSEVKRSLIGMAKITSSNVIPSKCTASGDGVKRSIVHRQTMVRITPRSSSGTIEREKDLKFTAKLQSSEVQVECQCIENPPGSYNVMYIAPQQGSYYLHVTLFGQHTKGSPYPIKIVPGGRISLSRKSGDAYELTRVHSIKSHPVSVGKTSLPRVASPRSVGSGESYSSLKILPSSAASHSVPVAPPVGDYIACIGKYGRKKGEFSNPQGVCTDSNNRIYCTDSSNQNIQIFIDNGTHISSIEKRGRDAGQFRRPIGICFSKDGYLLFSDYENKCVNVLKDGSFIRRFGAGKLIGPKGLAVTPRGTVLVADNKGNRLLEFSMKGRIIRQIPAPGADKSSQLTGPHYVAVSKQGEIFVTDFHSHCIKVFSRDGDYIRSFGQHGAGNGQFNAPTGISIDSHMNVLVSDWGNSRIQIFDEQGSFLGHVDTHAAPLFGPQSISATSENQVIVADSGNHCVKVFHYDAP